MIEEPSRAADRPRRTLHGRRRGRPLRPARRSLVETLLPSLDIALPAGDAPLDPATLFPPASCREFWLEIGFGAGEHLIAQANNAADVGVIGCEPFINGVAALLAGIDARNLDNVRIFRDDARLLLDRLTDACIGRAFVLFPDPWPKLRHHKRRIVAAGPVAALARVMRDGAELRIATDDPDYKSWILAHVLGHGAFEWCARRPDDWRLRPDDWPETRYEAKARAAGRTPSFFRFRRRPRAG
jgi:tRNA (guanine-N7-)-methyltransferase